MSDSTNSASGIFSTLIRNIVKVLGKGHLSIIIHPFARRNTNIIECIKFLCKNQACNHSVIQLPCSGPAVLSDRFSLAMDCTYVDRNLSINWNLLLSLRVCHLFSSGKILSWQLPYIRITALAGSLRCDKGEILQQGVGTGDEVYCLSGQNRCAGCCHRDWIYVLGLQNYHMACYKYKLLRVTRRELSPLKVHLSPILSNRSTHGGAQSNHFLYLLLVEYIAGTMITSRVSSALSSWLICQPTLPRRVWRHFSFY